MATFATATERPHQWIIRGNHHDAWGIGATDPISGIVALLEQAQLERVQAHKAQGRAQPDVLAGTKGS